MTTDYQQLLKKSALAILICILLVTLSYYFIDRPVASFANNLNLKHYGIFDFLTYIPAIIIFLILFVMIYLVIQLTRRPWNHFEKVLFVISVAVAIAKCLEITLKFIFGRYWPSTWTNHNPSWTQNQAYGFHPFHHGSWYTSFPSGHTMVIFTAMTIVWIIYPRWRWLSIILCTAVIIGLLALHYHFVSDIIAGAFLGGIIAAYSAKFINEKTPLS